MELTYKELQKREVINLVDGRSFGNVVDARFDFPRGILMGIYVPAHKNRGIFAWFDKSTIYIDVRKIKKIGGDVILVELPCGGECLPSTSVGKPQPKPVPPNPCAPHCPPPKPQPFNSPQNQTLDLSEVFDENGRLDLDDY